MKAHAKSAPVHGGNLDKAVQLFGDPERGWLDLSTGVNPKPYPFLMPPDEIFSKLPDIPLKHALLEGARHYIIPPMQLLWREPAVRPSSSLFRVLGKKVVLAFFRQLILSMRKLGRRQGMKYTQFLSFSIRTISMC